MQVKLISKPSIDPDQLCDMAAAICTNSEPNGRPLKGAMGRGHESVAEHAGFTFLIEDISRVTLAQLTRHRVASFSVESQRYAGVHGEMTIPDSVVANGYLNDFSICAAACMQLYKDMTEHGVPTEDARYIIPQGIETRLMMTMNVRELRHFFSLRMCNRAQWEIRELADAMYRLCVEAAPILFRDAGPGCVRGHCPEGKRSCGHPRTELKR